MKLAVAVVGALILATVGRVFADAPSPSRPPEKRAFDPASIYRVPAGTAPSDGPRDAPITIVVWSDYACGYCVRVQYTLDGLVRLYPGRIRFVHRTLPLDPDFTLAAEAALAAAAQGRFRPMHDRLFAVGGRIDRGSIELIARELGLDMVRLRADLDTRAHLPQIKADVADAIALGVTGTPTFFINGRPVPGGQNLHAFTEIVDEELVRAGKDRAGYDALVAGGKPAADLLPMRRPAFELDENQTYVMGLGLPGHQVGPDDALVTIVVWSDFQCPYCRKVLPALAHAREKYGPQVRIVYRHLPMQGHRNAQLAAEAAVAAAAQGKFWAFHDQVFANFGKLTRADLETFAQAANLDMAQFRAALDDRRHRDAVFAESASALALGVDGTPFLFLNGAPVGGSRDATTLATLIDAQLDHVRKALHGGVAPSDIYALVQSSALGVERSDPSTLPEMSVAHVAMRAEERARSVAAACRRRDPARAADLARGLAGNARREAALVCSAVGIDLN
ncbi:MAG: thioredoxin domain-containing protein [Deltaproteobacteria bacterium]|nr:thioredoxin domain-containing protein [Deltaproteobacteria bacterium]